jgi:predicted ATP-dependent serine protease
MTVDEPASDLGVMAAIASSVRNRVVPATTAMFGEVGLAGEVRGIAQAALRVREASQMGFRRCIMPDANVERAQNGARPKGAGADERSHDDERSRGDDAECELVGVRSIGEALDAALS